MVPPRKSKVLDKDQALVKLFHWGWGRYPSNSCWQAWGLIFFPLAVLFNVLDFTLGNVLRWIGSKLPKRKPSFDPYDLPEPEYNAWRAECKAKQARRRARFDWLIRSVEWFADHVWQPVKRFFQDHPLIGEIIGWILGGAAVLYIVGALVYLLIVNTVVTLIVFGSVALAFLALAGLYLLIDRTENSLKRFGRQVKEVAQHAYQSLHNRTCVDIEVRGAEDEIAAERAAEIG